MASACGSAPSAVAIPPPLPPWEDGLFHDILNDPSSFVDGTSAMMAATVLYRGLLEGWLDEENGLPLSQAEAAYRTMCAKVDDFGILHNVCGCPDFVSSGHLRRGPGQLPDDGCLARKAARPLSPVRRPALFARGALFLPLSTLFPDGKGA